MKEQVETTVNDQVPETAESQVKGSVENQVEETLDAQVELNKILNPTQEEKVETQVEEQVETETQVEAKPVIIDDTIIQQYPTLKMYRGKPLNDILGAYHNLTKAYGEDHKRLKQLEKEQAQKNVGDISKVPDPIEKPEEFKQWLVDERERIRQEALAEVQVQPQVNWVDNLKEQLPKDVDVNKVIDNWDKFNSKRLYNNLGELRPELKDFYAKNPEILIDEISSFYNLSSQAEKNQMTVQQESRNQAYKTVTNSLKKAQENKENLQKANFNPIQRTNEVTPEDEILSLIYKKSGGK